MIETITKFFITQNALRLPECTLISLSHLIHAFGNKRRLKCSVVDNNWGCTHFLIIRTQEETELRCDCGWTNSIHMHLDLFCTHQIKTKPKSTEPTSFFFAWTQDINHLNKFATTTIDMWDADTPQLTTVSSCLNKNLNNYDRWKGSTYAFYTRFTTTIAGPLFDRFSIVS